MVNKKAKGKRSKTRAKLKKKAGRATVNEVLRPFEKGNRIQIVIRPEMHSGMPPAIYQGAYGMVEKKQGSAYIVSVKKGSLDKKLTVAGIHLKQGAAK
jgi:ribosomal protein L21E